MSVRRPTDAERIDALRVSRDGWAGVALARGRAIAAFLKTQPCVYGDACSCPSKRAHKALVRLAQSICASVRPSDRPEVQP